MGVHDRLGLRRGARREQDPDRSHRLGGPVGCVPGQSDQRGEVGEPAVARTGERLALVVGRDGEPLRYNARDTLINPDFVCYADPSRPWHSYL